MWWIKRFTGLPSSGAFVKHIYKASNYFSDVHDRFCYTEHAGRGSSGSAWDYIINKHNYSNIAARLNILIDINIDIDSCLDFNFDFESNFDLEFDFDFDFVLDINVDVDIDHDYIDHFVSKFSCL